MVKKIGQIKLDGGCKLKETKHSKLLHKLELSVPQMYIQELLDRKALEVAPEYEIKGFRRGRVPLENIKKNIAKTEFPKIMEAVVKSVMEKLTSKLNITLYSSKITPMEKSEEKTFFLEITFEEMPKIELNDFSKIQVESIASEVDDYILGLQKKNLLEYARTLSDTGDKAKVSNDTVATVSLTVEQNGNTIAQESSLNLEKKLQDPFRAKLWKEVLDCQKEDQMTVSIKAPKGYFPQQADENQPVNCNIKILDIKKITVKGKFDDELLKKFKKKDIKELEADLKVVAKERVAQYVSEVNKKRLLDQLDTIYSFDLPESALANEKKILTQYANNSFDDKQLDKISARRVKLGILLVEIARLNNLKIEPMEVENYLMRELLTNPEKADSMRKFYSKKENLQTLHGPLLEQKAVDFLLTKVDNKVKRVSSEELQEIYSELILVK